MAIRIPDTSLQVDLLPDTCPECEHNISPDYKTYSIMNGYNIVQKLQVVYLCTNSKCQELFIAEYTPSRIRGNGIYDFSQAHNLKWVKEIEFPVAIRNISGMFVKIYNQANNAEANSLDLIAGPGYKKALEFLIKDYLITITPDNKEEIENLFLGSAIKRIEDKKIEAFASRASWLGNDESHYVRKWTEHDIKDLKSLINMVVNTIDTNMRYDEYVAGMPSKEPEDGS